MDEKLKHLNTNRLTLIALTAALAAIYFAGAKLGFAMAFEAEQVTIVWPPTGIALAAVLLLGYRALPGVMLGAFLANITSHESLITATAIAGGNTLESFSCAWLLHRFIGFDNALNRLRDVLGLVIFSATISTMLAATIGVTSLCVGGAQPWASFGSLWLTWWLGDATGALIIAPALLVWCGRSHPVRPRRLMEASILTVGLLTIGVVVFTELPTIGIAGRAFIYLFFPFIIWAALRFGQRGTTFVTVAASAIAIWATVHGLGPFSNVPVEQKLTLLQIFTSVTAVTGLLLSAAISERDIAERQQYTLLTALQDANRHKDEFLATLAHELRTPLAPLSNALHILKTADAGDARHTEARAIMERQVGQMVRLVDDLLDVSRISHGKIELRKAPITLAGIIDNAVEAVRPLVESKVQLLNVQIPEKTLWLNADSARLSQVFANLLNNAIKYTGRSGRIWLEASAEENAVTVKVRDTGIGIPAAMLSHVFDMFTQADTSIERTYGGLGIGLTLVKKLVEMHGGSVEATSAGIDKGSEFMVKLPLIQSPQTAHAPSVQPSNESEKEPGPLRVLVVDDNKTVAKTLGWMVESMGYETEVVYDGDSAVVLARSFLPDVILLDIGLSGTNGYEVCRRLRAEPALKHCVMIAQTGWSQEEHRRRSKEAGFDYHLVKPLNIDTLEEVFRSIKRP